MQAALLAGVQSGCGKTSVMLAMLQALARTASLTAFKAGPDFLDPLWHQAVTGQLSYNLDTRMMGESACRELLHRTKTEQVLVEGVMGMFDGKSGVGEAGSSADLARVLAMPVWLVVNAKGMSGSIVALVSGFVAQAEKIGVRISGIIANQVGSAHHASLLKDFLDDHELPPLLAWMEKNAPVLPERHLGLQRPEEVALPDFSSCFHLDTERLPAAWGEIKRTESIPEASRQYLKNKTIAIARDAACCFCYPANLDWLQAQGAALEFFSPLAGEPVPDNADALWLPGGYPELYAQTLSTSATLSSIRNFIETSQPVLAECGGMMILGKALIDHAGHHWPMANALPIISRMQDRLAGLGYRESETGARGHEFHHSVREQDENIAGAFNVSRGDKGLHYKKLRASYIHWYFPSAPEEAASWFGAEADINKEAAA